MDSKMMGYAEAAEFLGVPKGTLYSLVSRGRIPHYRIGPRFVRFRQEELEQWLHELRYWPATAKPV